MEYKNMKVKIYSDFDNTSLRSDIAVINEHSTIMLRQIRDNDGHVDGVPDSSPLSYHQWQLEQIQTHLTRAKRILRDYQNKQTNTDNNDKNK